MLSKNRGRTRAILVGAIAGATLATLVALGPTVLAQGGGGEGNSTSPPDTEPPDLPPPPPAPENLQAEPSGAKPGETPSVVPGTIRLTWHAAPPGHQVEFYRVYASDWEGYEQGIAEVRADPERPTFTEAGLGPSRTRSYYLTAVNAGGESPPSNRATATSFLACTVPLSAVCVGVHPVTWKANLLGARPAPPGDDAVLVPVEMGTLTITAGGEYAEQALVAPRYPGLPQPEALDQDFPELGVSTTYQARQPLPPFGGVVLDPTPGEPAVDVVGSLWAGRLWVYVAGMKVSDVPGVAVRQGTPGPDACACAPGPEFAGVLGAVLAGAMVLRRQGEAVLRRT